MSFRVTFLGTGGAVPTTERAPSALVVNREGDRLLFDCGEGTQRQMMRFGTGFSVSHVFLTHLHGDHVLGLPGLVQTWDFNDRTEPLSIHCPPNTRTHVKSLLRAGGHDPDFPIRINEVSPGNVAFRAEEYEVRVFRTNHRTRAQGYALIEDDRPGKFNREKAEEELGIPPGPAYGRLHEGEAVELDDGRVIHPEQVVGVPRPGRRFVYTGDTRPVDETVEIAENADLLVHDATFASEYADRARETAHSTAREAARIADRAGAKRLALVHISSRYAGDPSPIEREAQSIFGDAFVPDDGTRIEIPYPDA
ncbi:Ribonuclease Z, beta-lactamase superfamily hydrolase [Halalkaliarchaeum sp. AArc-CO]|uniref:ribonuclease Z n=1 Tax=Halalkaliarchaeum sp. AArc-CO TaxID=2866381 RepID=UPI00217DAC7E|nr:ribonuclease Z [Halalkaliarchaeum sp. AArc-CO]UWG49670.1 Ribonuclease Z, beta-lactamase superfamily hydrolase [Halalkaliarchaeum sp. AArc-CO]